VIYGKRGRFSVALSSCPHPNQNYLKEGEDFK